MPCGMTKVSQRFDVGFWNRVSLKEPASQLCFRDKEVNPGAKNETGESCLDAQ